MFSGNHQLLLAGICDFGWGSLGKFRLILDKLRMTDVALFGNTEINDTIIDLLGTRHSFASDPPERANVALVINDPAAANEIADLDVPVIYVDSLPYLWATSDELPDRENVACYCAQKFPTDRLPVAPPLQTWEDVHWIDPIVPTTPRRLGGHGVVVNVGGLHSHLVGDTVNAYLDLVLFPLLEALKEDGHSVSAVCGNLPPAACQRVQNVLPDCNAIGRQSPYDFDRIIRGADLLVSSPGSTTILQAVALELPTMLLPPQNLSQILNAILFSATHASLLSWPTEVMDTDQIEQLRPQGEDAVLSYIYKSICRASALPEASRAVAAAIRSALTSLPERGVLDQSVPELGLNGAAQVARLVRQAMLAPLPRPRSGGARRKSTAALVTPSEQSSDAMQ